MLILPPNGSSRLQQFKDPQSAVRIMQIVIAALMLGVVMFAGVAIFLISQPLVRPQGDVPLVLAYIGILAALINVVLRIVVPGFVIAAIIKTIVRANDQQEITKLDLYPAYFSGLLVGAALLEGAAFFNIVAVIIARQTWSFAIVGVLLALMAAAFPTLERVDNWADEQLRQLQLDPPRPI